MKLYLRLALIICLATSVFLSCRKIGKPGDSRDITLTHSISGNVITLKWTSVSGSSVSGYYITRTDSFSSVKSFTTNRNTTTLVDTLPLSPWISYSVEATVGSANEGHISNEVRVTRSDVALANIKPFDALYDKDQKNIFVYSADGDIQVYDITSRKWVRNASWSANIGYCDIGVYNGKTELYVPRQDGWLFIYDAATLTKTDQISVGTQLHGVCYNNGILYISGTVSSSYSYSIVSYSRESKTKIAQLNSSDKNRLKPVPGTNSDFYAITDYNNLRYYKFDGNGNTISQKFASTNNPYPSPAIFEVFPDGKKFITNDKGSIYGKDLDYETALPQGNATFTSFCFDNGRAQIVAGCLQKQIQAYSLNDYQLEKTIVTQGIPFRVFSSDGAVICVSTAPAINGGYYGALSSTTFIETF